MNSKEMGKALKFMRLQAKLELEDIEDKFSIPVNVMEEIEKGNVSMPLDRFIHLIRHLEVS